MSYKNNVNTFKVNDNKFAMVIPINMLLFYITLIEINQRYEN
ncbi:hypothetical protein [Winogradskyella echinorum]|nr:hypothetical protein [Winogradskyella echinorum]